MTIFDYGVVLLADYLNWYGSLKKKLIHCDYDGDYLFNFATPVTVISVDQINNVSSNIIWATLISATVCIAIVNVAVS